jgi:hypothetical protein
MLPKPAVLAALFAAAAAGWLLVAPATPPAADVAVLAVRQLHDPAAGAELDAARRASQHPTHLLPAAGLAVAALSAAGVAAYRTLTAREGGS